ncbi:hypothetical protein [Mycolicibacterium gilvum]|uniref:Phage gp6-like head-tail connector protein n=1 Tax=Mycolicibacterium gilvum TaxID=1804 RepID=A0A378SG77_9MYCO|nr:hypothetical protein [Mycolicibacterium gilvum]MCV7056295.1 hypothetical protein [Mycolicibacterium gilvum]STZ41720.1 Uncharacterised protein [Mycolicibacterium gilvum]
MPVTGQDVADFLGQGTDTALVALAGEVVPVITAMVSAYTRGRGFTATEPNNELAAVITTASARLVANPEQLSSKVGSVEIRGGFQGFSLAETFVLNRYRRTAL